ncbi:MULTISPECIES: helix-turn-helix domain-containing protein [Streptomyces]|jgi:transcriptional regulator with XRE-family HTH domain|uniref:helix-turn-helix domain-containing protein n=1 Tax=Streptomyces TaxID=1883 RepID=UPI0022506A4E|nr:helix-turn-helix transcriptional regulator [Streptomyces erythrochromogenes]MCX5588176.1 helix-turn-helix domain-containing protein [Streptomyces erythrochromogenes]
MARHFSGRRLREARKTAGLSPEHLAISVGRSAYSIHEYELGRVTPPITVIAAIADALGRSVDDLLTEEEAHAA